MIQPVEKKYCIGDLVQVMPNTEACHLIVSVDEIILLKVGDKILVNKYVNHPSRNLFPYQEKEMYDWCHFTELFKYNKTYLNFRGSLGGGVFLLDYFFRTNDSSLHLEESLPVEYKYNDYVGENSVVLNRQEIEEEFDGGNYDSMYVIDGNGTILFARDDREKIHFGENFIPSDEKIVEKELEFRKEQYLWTKSYYGPVKDSDESYKKATIPKTIDEIRNFSVGDINCAAYHLLLTIKDGKFNLGWFKVDFIEKDKFKLTTDPISIIEPTIDDLIQFSSNDEIENTPEPSKPIPSFKQVYTSENQETAMNTINSIIEGDDQKEPDKPQKVENGVYKKLRRLIKNNSTDSN